MAVILFGIGVGVVVSAFALFFANPSVLSILAIYGSAGVAGSAALIVVLLRTGEADDSDAHPPKSVGNGVSARAPPREASHEVFEQPAVCAMDMHHFSECASPHSEQRLATSS